MGSAPFQVYNSVSATLGGDPVVPTSKYVYLDPSVSASNGFHKPYIDGISFDLASPSSLT